MRKRSWIEQSKNIDLKAHNNVYITQQKECVYNLECKRWYIQYCIFCVCLRGFFHSFVAEMKMSVQPHEYIQKRCVSLCMRVFFSSVHCSFGFQQKQFKIEKINYIWLF